MLSRLFARSAPLLAKAPAGLRIYAIGDVHGCADQLRSLIAAIEADHAARPPADLRLILLGDLVDRGPASAAVLDQVSALRDRYPTLRTLMGNHEEIMLKAVEGDKEAMRFFLRFGGTETLLSYGVDPGELERSDWDEAITLAQRAIPAAHLDFMRTFENIVQHGDYVFVHAGIRPGRAIEAQEPADLRWIRKSFLDHKGDHGAIIVHGHTISDEPEVMSNRIGIDTGAFQSGILTALALEDDRRWFLTAGTRRA